MISGDLKILFSGLILPVEKNFEANEFIFQQGDLVKDIFAVESGQINLERYTIGGTGVRIHQAKAGECFAEASLFSDNYDCCAIAAKTTRLTAFPKDEVLSILHKCPEIALKYIALLSDQVKALRMNLHLRTMLSARERILDYLKLFANPETMTFEIRSTLKDISAQIGIAHETLYRELKKLEQDSIIERSENKIKLLSSV